MTRFFYVSLKHALWQFSAFNHMLPRKIGKAWRDMLHEARTLGIILVMIIRIFIGLHATITVSIPGL